MYIDDSIALNITLFTSTAALVNATLIQLEGSYILVDTMLRPMDSAHIRDRLGAEDISPDYIINTHWHSDHCFGNRILKTPRAKVLAHPRYADTLRRERNMFKPGHSYEGEKALVAPPDLLVETSLYWQNGGFVSPDELQSDSPLHVYHAPGHSFDMLNIYLPEQKIVLAGDNLLSNLGDSIALPYFFWGDCRLLIQSLKQLRELEPDLIIPGHGKPVTLDKLDSDLFYLENLLKASVSLLKTTDETDIDALHQMLLSKIDAHDLYPTDKTLPFWVPAVHELNLKRLCINHNQLGGQRDFS
jgi:glyoxylase-like metal-dependent hydrolase (beta-lactamase superfamily II)